jgi:hypothetical protein
MVKTVSQLNDPQKPIEILKTPSILSISDEKEQTIVLFFQTYGRYKATTTAHQPSVTIEVG